MLKGKHVLLGVTGGIASYKIATLASLLVKAQADVHVIMTENAANFINPITFETLTGHKCITDTFDRNFEFKVEHIALAQLADVVMVAPATANVMAKLAHGLADDMLTTTVLASRAPKIIAPAMNTGMWNNKAVQKNIETLKSYSARFVDPDSGYLACGTEGKGRLADLNDICDAVKNVLQNADESADNKFLKGKKVVITAGGTKENFDPVRYIGNYSSGKMGAALAKKAFEAGASVTLIETTPLLRDCSDSINTVDVVSAKEMLEAVKEEFLNKNADILIMTAAVADYRPETTEQLKVKKENTDELTLKLVKNPDILSEMCKLKKEGMQIVGFCAETNDLIENAKAKIKRKGCDWLVANDVSRKDTGFSSDFNEVYVLDKNLNIVKIDKDTKENIASKILEQIWQKQVK